MRIEWALRHHRGIAKTKDLQRFGVSRDEIYTAMREGRVLRIRNGWFCLPSAHPMEVRAVSDRGLLTCSAAARVLGLPAENNEYHLRAPRPVPGVRTNCRRLPAQRIGGLVTLVDVVEDYAACQAPAWTLALLDALVREARVSADELRKIGERLPQSRRYLVDMVSEKSESALESVARFHLTHDRFPFREQVRIGSFRVDFLVGNRLVLETHGAEFHAGREPWERDRARTLWLRKNGWDVLELTYAQVNDWQQVSHTIRTCLKNPRYVDAVGLHSV